jgi:hypothetical protein
MSVFLAFDVANVTGLQGYLPMIYSSGEGILDPTLREEIKNNNYLY